MMLKKWVVIFLLCSWVTSVSATVCGPHVCRQSGFSKNGFSRSTCQKEADGVVTGVISQMKDIPSTSPLYKIPSTHFVLTVSSWQKKPKGISMPAKISFQNDNCMSPHIQAKASDSIRAYFKTSEHDGVRYYWLIDHEVLANH